MAGPPVARPVAPTPRRPAPGSSGRTVDQGVALNLRVLRRLTTGLLVVVLLAWGVPRLDGWREAGTEWVAGLRGGGAADLAAADGGGEGVNAGVAAGAGGTGIEGVVAAGRVAGGAPDPVVTAAGNGLVGLDGDEAPSPASNASGMVAGAPGPGQSGGSDEAGLVSAEEVEGSEDEAVIVVVAEEEGSDSGDGAAAETAGEGAEVDEETAAAEAGLTQGSPQSSSLSGEEVVTAGTPLWATRPVLAAAAGKSRVSGTPPLADWAALRRAVDALPVSAQPGSLNADQRLALLRWDLGSRSGAESLKSVADTEPGRAMLGRLGEDDGWLRELLDVGPWPEKGAAVVPLLAAMVQADPGVEADPVLRPMASALAVAGAARDWDADYVVARQAYFADRYRSGRLNLRFEQLQPWERYWVAFGVQHERFNRVESMAYLNDTAALPIQDYLGACWRPEYRLENYYGETIHGPHFYSVFESAFPNQMKLVESVGGVCGSLSNFGGAAAVANGVPALTMGEPGHCAYAVMVTPGRMVPSYSLSWERGLHTPVYGWGWSEQRAYEIAHEDLAKFAQGREALRLARALAGRGLSDPDADGAKWTGPGKEAADELWQAAIGLVPTDLALWQSYREFGQRSDADLAWWQAFHRAAAAALGPRVGGLAWDQCRVAEEAMVTLGVDPEELAQTMAAFHSSLGVDWGESRWPLAEALKTQAGRLPDAAAREAFLAQALRGHLTHPVLLGDVILAGATLFGEDPEQQRKFYEFVATSAQSLGGEGGKEALTRLAQTVIPAAEAAADRETFQRVGRLVSEFFPAVEVEIEPFSGDLLSSGGLLKVGGVGNHYDNPAQHWGVLEPRGGAFHTDGGELATATVELGSYGEISGIVLVQIPHNQWRIEGCQVETSVDGTAWMAAAKITETSDVIRLDLEEKRPAARFVRLTNAKGEVLHLRQILVFGRKLS